MIPINSSKLTFGVIVLTLMAGSLAATTTGIGCAKVTSTSPMSGTGGTGVTNPPPGGNPPIPNLTGLTVAVSPQAVTLMPDNNMAGFFATATFTAMGSFNDGSTSDVTGRVNWSLDPSVGSVSAGAVRVTSPGNYMVIASSGTIKGVGQLTAVFTGNNLGPGFMDTDRPKLDGTATPGSVSVAYPVDGAIFPSNFGAVTFQISKSGSQDIARLSFTGDGLDIKHYGVCEPGPGAGCYVTLPSVVTKLFLATSAQNDITMTARLGSLAGGAVAESGPVKLAWANVALSGGLYYWTTVNPGSVPGYVAPDPADPRGTAVMRYNFDGDASKPELIWTDRGSPRTVPPFQESPPAQGGNDPVSGRVWGEGRCIGCHAISPDGKLMAFSIGGSDASSWAILNIGTTTLNELDPLAASATSTGIEFLKRDRKGNFASFTTFGPNSDLMVNMYRGKFTLRGVNPALPIIRDDLFGTKTVERKTDPYWSPDGKTFAFTTYDLNQETQPYRYNGDAKTGGQIWVSSADATTGPHDDAKIVVPRQAGITSYYPAISNDGTLLVFNKSQCAGPATPGGYGIGPCDGYDDISAALWLTDPTGHAPVALARANGVDPNNSNSWPRWSPDNGGFRGQRLYWLAFSSRRPYGLQVNSGSATSVNKPQLWFSAILVGEEFATDPSRAPVWLPNQNLSQAAPTGNHVPQWVKFAVPIE